MDLNQQCQRRKIYSLLGLPIFLQLHIRTSYWFPCQPLIEQLLCPSPFIQSLCAVELLPIRVCRVHAPRLRFSATGSLSLIKRYFNENSNGIWYERRDSNPQGFRRQILSLLCIPFHHSRVNLVERRGIEPLLPT